MYMYMYMYMYIYVCMYISLSLSIYIYIYINAGDLDRGSGRVLELRGGSSGVSGEDSLLFGPSPWKILRHYLLTSGFLSNPAPGENLLSGNLVMETV